MATTDAEDIEQIDNVDPNEKQITRDYPMTSGWFGGSRYFANLGTSEGFTRDTRPDLIGFDTLDRMRRHAPIKAALMLIKMPILSRVRQAKAKCDDPDIQATVQQELIDSGLLYKLAVTSMRALDFGAAFHEKRWITKDIHVEYETEDIDTGERTQTIAWDGIAHTYKEIREVNPATVSEILRRTELRGYTGSDADESFDGFVQGVDQAGKPREVDAWRAFIYTYNKEYGNMWGEARDKDAFPYYSWAQFVLKAWMMWVERKVIPPNKAWFPMGTSLMPNGQKVDNQLIALMMGKAINNSSTIALPSTNIAKDARGSSGRRFLRDWDVEELQRTDVTEIFKTTKEELDNDMFRAMFTPPRTFDSGSGDGGLFSTDAQTHFDVFLSTEDGIILDFGDCSADYMVQPFVMVNFGEDAPPCRVDIPGLSDEQRQMLETTFQALLVNVDNQARIDFDAMAKQFTVPLKDVTDEEDEELEFDTGNPINPNQPDTTGLTPPVPGQPPTTAPATTVPPTTAPSNLLLDDETTTALTLADMLEAFAIQRLSPEDVDTLSIELAGGGAAGAAAKTITGQFNSARWTIEPKADSPLGYKVTDNQDGRVLGGFAAMQVIKAYEMQGQKAAKGAASQEKSAQRKAEAESKHQAVLAAQAQRKAEAAAKKTQTEQTTAAKRAEMQAKREAAATARQAKQAQSVADRAAKATERAAAKQQRDAAHASHIATQAQAKAASQVIDPNVTTNRAEASKEAKNLGTQTAVQNGQEATATLAKSGWTTTGQYADKNAAIAQATQEAESDPKNHYTVVAVAGGFVVASKATTAAPAPPPKPVKPPKAPKPAKQPKQRTTVKASNRSINVLQLAARRVRGVFSRD